MTQWNKTTVSCPACLEEGTFKICTFVDFAESPDLKESIFNRSLFRYTCPECGEEILVSYNCTYLDKDNRFMVALIPSKDDSTIETAGYTLRIVRSINEMVEKIALMEEGIDDRIIELYKIMLEDQFEEERQGTEILGIYYGGQNPETKNLLFYIITGNAENCRAELSFEAYNAIAAQLGPSADFFEECAEVNRIWAVSALQNGFPCENNE